MKFRHLDEETPDESLNELLLVMAGLRLRYISIWGCIRYAEERVKTKNARQSQSHDCYRHLVTLQITSNVF